MTQLRIDSFCMAATAAIRPPYNVRFGYSIYSQMKQQKPTFNSYNLFLDVVLIQNMINVFLITQILHFTPSR